MAAVVTEPTSASPAPPMTAWDEAAVQSWLADLGLGQYEDRIYEHGITGEVLAALDHEALQDLGITSLGHRLNVLRAVYELKLEQGIEVGDDDWRPKEEVGDKLREAVQEMRDRLAQLERDHNTLLDILETSGVVVADTPSASLPSLTQSLASSSTTPAIDRRNPPPLPPASVAPPLSAGFDTFTPTTSGANPFDSPGLARRGTHSSPGPVPLSRSANNSSQGTAGAAGGANGANGAAATAAAPGTSGSPAPDSDRERERREHERERRAARSRAKDEAHSTARSFRVTMEDPCIKVLPAALKKYKINDDWKLYALFITFGNGEKDEQGKSIQPDRCLAYDEKPLLLYQKIKETGQRPTFMLRHIKDIRNPIALAQAKQLMRLGLPPDSERNVLPTLEASSPTKHLAPDKRTDDGTARGAFPEQPSPGLGGSTAHTPGTVVDREGNVQKVTYAIAIYPYIADRQDEFDVAVGATFVVLSKAKGWWIVQKDPKGLGNIVPDTARSGWVPAGCLLETSAPIAATSADVPPSRAPIATASIMSSSYPGVVLMDYDAKSDDEMSVREGDMLRIYKKYAHWSYAENGDRGWVPQWYVGKMSSESQPASAAASTPAPGVPTLGEAVAAAEERD